MTWLAGFLWLGDPGYEPRHCSKRHNGSGHGRLARGTGEDMENAVAGRPIGPGRAGTSWLPCPPVEREFPDQAARDQLRHVLEGCALDDLRRIVPEIVRVIVHSSADTTGTAWNDFREGMPEEDSVVLKLGQAHDALWVITKGPSRHVIPSR
jgi:hypothetical protein